MNEPGTLRLIVRIEAETDITDHAVWYERKEAGLGQAFLTEVDVVIAAIVANPFRFPRLRRRPEVRRALTDRFPHRVFFIRRDNAIVVFRVLHGAQHDREWRSRLASEPP